MKKNLEVRKSIKGIEKKEFYYSYLENNKKKVRKCINCSSFEEAAKFIEKRDFYSKNEYLICNIAKDMFLPGSKSLERLAAFGKSLSERTINQRQMFLKRIIQDFGNCNIKTLKISAIEEKLMADNEHSGSWKNSYLETFSLIYDETVWKCRTPVCRPKFQRFARNSVKPDILLTFELYQSLIHALLS